MFSSVQSQCRANFRPEFINRVDEFIIFDPLAQDQIKEIVRIQVGTCVRSWKWVCACVPACVCAHVWVHVCVCVCICVGSWCACVCWFLVRMCVRMCVCVGAAHVCVLPVACFFGHVTRFVAAPKRNEMKNCAAARYARPVTIVCGPSLLCFIKCKSASVI